MLGGVAYFAVPWAVSLPNVFASQPADMNYQVGTTAGLAAIGLESSSIFPTYPRASIEHLLVNIYTDRPS